MKIKLVPVLVVAVVTVLLAGGAAAATKKAKQQTISLDRPALVGSTVLPAGSYQLELVGSDIARFVQQDRTVAELPCKVGLAQVVYGGNAVQYLTGGSGPDRLVQIVLTRSKLAIVFPSESEVAQAAY